ncbi:MAG: Crp/Fnr family transcriptional regulator [Sphingobium phenoxybenzoativorans]|uniref:Crp/Fnr family transcriptional regulator n=1 Tax=Sphingobium phenoxybenzoativorans TaxID=1592790 RepID=UPI000872F750|nr:cyclic nucleotide-binding domain-containing protein [Sphingobium phenoxybenzoativorans]
MQSSTNLVLTALEPADAERLSLQMEKATFARGACILHAHRPIEHIHFVEDGIASMLSTRTGERRAEVALIGRDGLCGTAGLMMAEHAAHDVVVQVDDARTVRVPLNALLDLMAQSASLRRVLLRYV